MNLANQQILHQKIVGDGNNINFWYDTWFDQPIRNSIFGPLPHGKDKRTVSNIIKEKSNCNFWYLDDLPFKLPEHKVLEIKALPLPQGLIPLKDNTVWKLSSNDLFSSKSAYLWLLNHPPKNFDNPPNHDNKNFLWICKVPSHPRELFFPMASSLQRPPFELYSFKS